MMSVKFRRLFHFMCILWWFVLTLMIDTQYNTTVSSSLSGSVPPPLLLLISFDGFRWDYLHTYKLPNFEYLRRLGSHADFIHNSFSTITFPNHWTMVTGLYEESHGIVQNHMYDPALNKTFHYTSPETQTIEWFGQNKLAEPVWATNQRGGAGRRSAAEWIGANVVFNNQSIINIPFNRSMPYKDLMDRFVDLFVDDDPINFGAIYFDEPGHMYGPYSKQMQRKLEELDDYLGYLIDQLNDNNLFSRLNLIITSDHGMESISKNTTIYLDTYIDTNLFESYGSRACYVLFVKNDTDLPYVYNTLKSIPAIDVYKRDEIPEHLNYRENIRLGHLLIVTHIGHAVYITNQTVDWTINNGDHGYYNNESSMHPLFIAHGPAFKNDFKIKSFRNVDIYPLMCHILGVEPATHNGSLNNVVEMLAVYYSSYPSYASIMVFMVPFGILALSLVIVWLLSRVFVWVYTRANYAKTVNKNPKLLSGV